MVANIESPPSERDSPAAASTDAASLMASYPPDESPLVARALDLIGAAHQDDSRGANDAIAVAGVLRELGLDHECIAAAIVHSALEAGSVQSDSIRREFGDRVARLVDGVTRMDAMHTARTTAKVRDPKQLERLKNLLLAMVEDVRVVLIKLAECLVTMRRLRELPEDRRKSMARASLDVYAPLASRLGIRHFKWELEDLAFRGLEAETYMTIARDLDSRRADRERYIDKVVSTLSGELERVGVNAEVSGRPKHIYSIWRKMCEKELSFDQVFDLRAVRVLVDDVAACYSALGVVHGLWTHVPREFDDYITNPKANRYQSLHTAVIGPSGKTVEVQIRSRDMHVHAEYGVAAHWRYKEGQAGSESDLQAKVAWLRQVLEWKDYGEGPGDILDQLNTELLGDRVYVVTPRGQILDLPKGATPLDFAYQIHTDVGHRCRGAKVNGRMVPLTHVLESGDQVEILTTRNASPSRDWLNPNLGYLATGRARAKARHWFRQLDYDKNLGDGQEIFARELKRLGVADPDRSKLTSRFNYKRFDDLLAGLGRGDVSSVQLANALQEALPARPDLPVTRPAHRPATPRGGAVQIHGVGNLLTQIANCCKPVPPEPIVGFITKGRGVSIHRRDCSNVMRLSMEDQARVIDVSWGQSDKETYPVAIQVIAYDRHGLLRDVTAVVANEHVNVAALTTQDVDRDQLARVDLTVEVADLAELGRVMDRLTQLSNVVEVRRAG
jgi:GTP pyrophosphokinase